VSAATARTIVITKAHAANDWKFKLTEPLLILVKTLGFKRSVKSEYVRKGTYWMNSSNIGIKMLMNEYSAEKIMTNA